MSTGKLDGKFIREKSISQDDGILAQFQNAFLRWIDDVQSASFGFDPATFLALES